MSAAQEAMADAMALLSNGPKKPPRPEACAFKVLHDAVQLKEAMVKLTNTDPEVELMQRGELEYIRNQRELERVLGSCNPSRTHSRAVSASGRPEGSTQHTHNARLLPTPPSLGLPQALTVSNDSEGDDGSSSDSGTGSDGAFSPHVKFMLPPDTLYSPVDPADDSQPYYFGSSPLDDANSSNILHQRPSLGLGAGPRAPSWMMQAGQHHKQRDEGVSVLGAKVKEAMEKVEGTRPQDLPKEGVMPGGKATMGRPRHNHARASSSSSGQPLPTYFVNALAAASAAPPPAAGGPLPQPSPAPAAPAAAAATDVESTAAHIGGINTGAGESAESVGGAHQGPSAAGVTGGGPMGTPPRPPSFAAAKGGPKLSGAGVGEEGGRAGGTGEPLPGAQFELQLRFKASPLRRRPLGAPAPPAPPLTPEGGSVEAGPDDSFLAAGEVGDDDALFLTPPRPVGHSFLIHSVDSESSSHARRLSGGGPKEGRVGGQRAHTLQDSLPPLAPSAGAASHMPPHARTHQADAALSSVTHTPSPEVGPYPPYPHTSLTPMRESSWTGDAGFSPAPPTAHTHTSRSSSPHPFARNGHAAAVRQSAPSFERQSLVPELTFEVSSELVHEVSMPELGAGPRPGARPPLPFPRSSAGFSGSLDGSPARLPIPRPQGGASASIVLAPRRAGSRTQSRDNSPSAIRAAAGAEVAAFAASRGASPMHSRGPSPMHSRDTSPASRCGMTGLTSDPPPLPPSLCHSRAGSVERFARLSDGLGPGPALFEIPSALARHPNSNEAGAGGADGGAGRGWGDARGPSPARPPAATWGEPTSRGGGGGGGPVFLSPLPPTVPGTHRYSTPSRPLPPHLPSPAQRSRGPSPIRSSYCGDGDTTARHRPTQGEHDSTNTGPGSGAGARQSHPQRLPQESSHGQGVLRDRASDSWEQDPLKTRPGALVPHNLVRKSLERELAQVAAAITSRAGPGWKPSGASATELSSMASGGLGSGLPVPEGRLAMRRHIGQGELPSLSKSVLLVVPGREFDRADIKPE